MPYVKIIAEADFGTFATSSAEVSKSDGFYGGNRSGLAADVARILGWTVTEVAASLDYTTQLIIVSAGGRSS